MADLLTWKFLAPAGGVAALLGIIVMRPGSPREEQPAKRSESTYAVLGYLSPKELPDSATLLPPPPKAGSNEMRRDEQARAAALKIDAGPRYQLATLDANREQASTAAAFQCAFT